MTYGQTLLHAFLLRLIKQAPEVDARPSFLNGLEIDFWYPYLLLGFEFQGGQHFTKTEFGDPKKQKQRDRAKRLICHAAGIKLYCVDASDLIWSRLRHLISELPKREQLPVAENMDALNVLNRKAAAYRSTLKASFGCITAHRQGSEIRREAKRKKNAVFTS